MKKRLSPFSREFWLEKGLNIEEADFKRNSSRPIKKEYWLVRGHSEEESIKLAEEQKRENDLKGAKKSRERSAEERRKTSVRCIEFYLESGYSEEEARKKISKLQSTFSLEKCIKRHGIIKGTEIWENRQIKWQNTLSKKTTEEISDINNKKNCLKLCNFSSIDECIERLNKTRNMNLFKTSEEFASYIENVILKKSNYLKYLSEEEFVETRVSKIQREIFETLGINIFDSIRHLFLNKKEYMVITGHKQSLRKRTEEGYLRSSFEIYFYDKVKEKFPDISMKVDKPYPDSKMRFDFEINGTFIEICPMIHNDKKYSEKMKKKKKLFGCVLLSSIEEIDRYIERMAFFDESNN